MMLAFLPRHFLYIVYLSLESNNKTHTHTRARALRAAAEEFIYTRCTVRGCINICIVRKLRVHELDRSASRCYVGPLKCKFGSAMLTA